jgi:probable rRNA maturation factor
MRGSPQPVIEIAVEAGEWPPEEALRRIAQSAVEAALKVLAPPTAEGELSILFTDDAQMRELNAEWRGIDKPTNVLSFPQAPAGAAPSPAARGGPQTLLGDIVLAAETVAGEAALAELPLEDHVAHLIVHGFLHLLGYDHEVEAEAERMEDLERAALSLIGIPDPTAAARRR